MVSANVIVRNVLPVLLASLGVSVCRHSVVHAEEKYAAEPCSSVKPCPASSLVRLLLLAHPANAHVYVNASGEKCAAAVCTGFCLVTLPSGTYTVRAGESHDNLSTAPDSLVLVKGEESRLKVEVRRRTAARAVAGGLMLAGVAALASAAVTWLVHGSIWESAPHDGVTIPLLLVGSAGALAGAGTAWWSTSPDVEYRKWKE